MNRPIITTVAVAVVAVALSAVTGCARLPQPVSPIEPPRPTLTKAEATALHTRIAATLTKADRAHSPATAAEVLTGPALQGRTADYDRFARWGRPLPKLKVAGRVLTVSSPAAADYPRRAVVVSSLTPSKKDPDDRLVEIVERRGAGEPWRLLAGVSARAKDVPALAVDPNGVSAPPPDEVNGFDLPGAKALAAAVDDPDAHRKQFALTASLRFFADGVVESRNAHTRASQSVRPLPGQFVVPTADGGALIVSTLLIRSEQQMTGDWYFYFLKDEPMRKQYPGHYTSSTDSFSAAFLVHVPRAGKITVAGKSFWWVGEVIRP